MSSQKGNSSRSRAQKHKNSTAFKNDKYGATVQVQKANSKVHAGLCQRCKEVLEWKVKYSKYKSLTQARTCVKCSQKTVKDSYHVICKPCSLQLEVCAKCGKKEDIVIPINAQTVDEEEQEEDNSQSRLRLRKKDNLDKDSDLGSDVDEDDKDFGSDEGSKKTQSKAAAIDMSRVRFED